MTRAHNKVTGRDVAVAAGIGLAVAGLAGLAAGAAIGTGMVALATSTRRAKKALKAVSRDDEGRLQDWQSVLKDVQNGGIAPELRADVWPLLLGVYSPASSEDDRLATLAQLRSLYTKLVLVCKELEAELEAEVEAAREAAAAQARLASVCPPSGDAAAQQGSMPAAAAVGSSSGPGSSTFRTSSSSSAQQQEFQKAHRTIVMDAVRTDFGSADVACAPAAAATAASNRSTGVRFGSPTVTLLPVAVVDGIPEIVFVEHAPLPPTAPAAPSAAAHGMNGNTPLWTSVLAAEALAGATHVPEARRVQMLRLINLLTAYAIHDPETSYCQGMSDLAAVFIQMFEDDAVAFACFERLMRHACRNFKHDETGIKRQLRQVAVILEHTDPTLYQHLARVGAAPECMWAYRMLLVLLRRELSVEHAMTLWEMQWAREAAVAELQAPAPTRPPCSGSVHSSSRGLLRRASSSVLAGAGGEAEQSVGSGGSRGSWLGAVGAGLARAGSGGAGASPSGSAAPDELVADGNFLHWFIASVAVLSRRQVMCCADTDDVLRLFNGVNVDFWATLHHAEKSFKRYEQGWAVMQRL